MKLMKLLGLAMAGWLMISSIAHADRLANIKKAGVLRVGVLDGNPLFGSVDARTHQLVGYDVDFANQIARHLGVRLRLVATNPANRIPFLTSNKVDAVIADFTITPERARVVDFSVPYFVTGQQFVSRKGVLKTPAQLNSLRIGVVSGTTEETTIRTRYPHARIITYNDIPFAFAALRNGNVQTITEDGAVLVGLLGSLPDKANYELSPFSITVEKAGVAVPRGEVSLLRQVNDALVHAERDGSAARIFDKWLGKGTVVPLKRNFRITAN